MKTKLFKKTAAFTLASAMALSSAMYALVGSAAEDVTITLENCPRYGDGYSYTAYQIFKGTPEDDTKLKNIEWGDAISSMASSGAYDSSMAFVMALEERADDFIALIEADEEHGGEFDPEEDMMFDAEHTEAATVAAILETYIDIDGFAELFAEVAAEFPFMYAHSGSWGEGADASTYTFSGLTPGYYLIVDSSRGVADEEYVYSSHILRVAQSVTLSSKNSLPTVSKEIIAEDGEATDAGTTAIVAGIGDTVSYSLTGNLPSNYADFAHFYYAFRDTLPAGLDLQESTIKVSVAGGEEIEVPAYDSSLNGNEDPAENQQCFYTFDGTVLRVIFPDLRTAYPDLDPTVDTVVVTYDCVVNADANVYAAATDPKDNVNEVDLTFTNSPYTEYDGTLGNTPGTPGTPGDPDDPDDPGTPGTPDTPEEPDDDTTTTTVVDQADVYVLQLNIHKQKDDENDSPLAGVGFTIQNEAGEYAVAEEESEGSGVYTITGWTADADDATEFTTPESGDLAINGLDDGTYTISETTTPPGYIGVDDFTITISDEATETDAGFNLAEAEAELDDDAEEDTNISISATGIGYASLLIINETGSNLPSTGGSGVYFYYAVGGALTVLAAGGLILAKRKKDQ